METFQLIAPIIRRTALPLDLYLLKAEDGNFATITEDGLVGLLACDSIGTVRALNSRPCLNKHKVKRLTTVRALQIALNRDLRFIAYHHGAVMDLVITED